MLKKENENLRSLDNQKLKEDYNLIRLPISAREVVTDNNKFCTYYAKTKTMIISLLNLKRRIYVDRKKKGIISYMPNTTRLILRKSVKKQKITITYICIMLFGSAEWKTMI